MGGELRRLGGVLVLMFGVGGCQPEVSSRPVVSPGSTARPSSTVAAPTATVAPMVREVEIRLFGFKPEVLEVPVGTTVRWVNRDPTIHTVSAGFPEAPSGLFHSGPLAQDRSFSFAFSQPGEYPYFCERHTSMRGIIRVVPSQP